MTHLDLFSGIGGFALAAEAVWPDAEHIFCEIDPFCRTILKKHWPHAPIYEDIRTLTNTSSQRTGMEKSDSGRQEWKGTNTPQSTLVRQGDGEGNAEGVTAGIDLLTGGFPCQPFSHAGQRKGTNDDRHLWPEMRRVIQEFAPRYVVAENVRGLLSIDGGMVFEQVCLDLEALEYEVQTFIIPACAVGAPHRRDRIWFVAHLKDEKWNGVQSERRGLQNGVATSMAHRKGLCTGISKSKEDNASSIPNWKGEWNDSRSHQQGQARQSTRESADSFENGKLSEPLTEKGSLLERPKGILASGNHCYGATETTWDIQNKKGSEPSVLERETVCDDVAHAKHESTGDAKRGGVDQGASARATRSDSWDRDWREVALTTCADGVDDGLPSGIPRPRGWRNAALKAYGNAIVPQVAEQIFRTIKHL